TRDAPALDVSVRGGDGCFLADDIVLYKLPQSAPPCPCYDGEPGTYCGSGSRAYAAAHGCWLTGVSGYEHNLLHCHGAGWSVGETCANGCYDAPSGISDGCLPPPTAPPCDCFSTPGIYCSKAIIQTIQARSNGCQVPGIEQHTNDLWLCMNSVWTFYQACPHGCLVNVQRTNDTCLP